jgi:hypothetical protein
MEDNAASAPSAYAQAENLASQIIARLKPSQHVFDVEQGGTNFHIYHTRLPGKPRDPITIALVALVNPSDPIVMASLLEGWVDEATITAEIEKGRKGLH